MGGGLLGSLSKFLFKYHHQKKKFEGFIVKYRYSDQVSGNFPGDEIPFNIVFSQNTVITEEKYSIS